MEKTCCICRANFIPTGESAETLHWCSECREELLHEVESMCVNCGSVPEKVTFCEERDADFCESCF